MEQPQYSVSPSVRAIVLPHIFQLALLSLFFYAGIFVNLSILKIAVPFWANISIALLLVILSLIQVEITAKKAKQFHYDFYPARIEFCGKRVESLLYSEIESVKISRELADSFSGTGTISLSKKFSIKNVKNYKEIQEYINNIIRAYQTAGRQQQFTEQAA